MNLLYIFVFYGMVNSVGNIYSMHSELNEKWHHNSMKIKTSLERLLRVGEQLKQCNNNNQALLENIIRNDQFHYDHSSNCPIEFVKLLLVNGTVSRDSALAHYAAERNMFDVARLLVKSGVFVNSLNSDNQTLLHCALYTHVPYKNEQAQYDFVMFLLEQGIETHVVDLGGVIPIRFAFTDGCSQAIRRTLFPLLQENDFDYFFNLKNFNEDQQLSIKLCLLATAYVCGDKTRIGFLLLRGPLLKNAIDRGLEEALHFYHLESKKQELLEREKYLVNVKTNIINWFSKNELLCVQN